MLLRISSAIAALLLTASQLIAQVPPEKAEATFKVNDPELEWKLWAHESMFSNPTCIDIDHLGRVWVCESVNYRHTLFRKPPNRPEGDRILILEDSKGTGKADKVTVFYQAPDLLAPLGIAVAKDPVGPGYKVYVCHSPDILLFEDKDGDGKADGPPKKLLSGFKGYDHDHGVHGILIGPDGKLYFSVGDQGVDGLKDKNGKVWKSNNTDCRAGTVWRCDMDGTNLELLAHNFRNPYEPCVDSFGTIFMSDNDDDGNQQTRICYVMPGGNYGYHPRGPGQTHWHEEQPGVVPKILRTYFGSPTGMCVYEGTLLPKKYWGQVLHTDAGPRHVRCYHMKPQGAGYDVERQDIVESTDNWFRPSDICVAPDGSVFVADWYDPGVGGHGMGDTTRGRVYRLAPKGHKYQVPKVDLESPDGFLNALGSANLAVRHMAIAALRSFHKDDLVRILTRALDQDVNAALRARALWQFFRYGFQSRRLEHALKADDPRLRVEGVRVLAQKHGAHSNDFSLLMEGFNALTDSLQDVSSQVRRECLVSMGDSAVDASTTNVFWRLAEQYDGKDRFYLAAIGIAVGTDLKRREIILADFEKHFPEWNEKTANLVWELRPPSMMPRLEKMVADAKLPAAQRVRIVDILAANDDPAAGKMLLNLLLGEQSPEVRDGIVSNLKQFVPGKWRDLRRSPEMGEAIERLLGKPDTAATGIALAALSQRAEFHLKVREMAVDGSVGLPTQLEAVHALGTMPFAGSAETLAELAAAPEAKSLSIAAVQALGQHVDGRRENPTAAPALAALQTLVRQSTTPLDVRQAALTVLAGSRAGMQWLLQQQTSKSIPPDLLADAGRLARNTPHQDLRNRALLAFPPPGKLDVKKLPSPAVLATRTGDAGRGRQVFAASLKNDLQCEKCHTVQGVGGNVGPDLSMIGKKASRENLFESILQPSKAIADQYVNWQIFSTRGAVMSGLLVEETAEAVTLRDANGKDMRIDKKDIDTREKNPVSLMPDNLVGAITEEDLVDLVEYLTTLKTPALTPATWLVAGPFKADGRADALDQVFEPEKGAGPAGINPAARWKSVAVDGVGYVDLQAHVGTAGGSLVAYLTKTIESPADQDARILLGTHGAAKVWINGTVVHTNRKSREAVPADDAISVRLRKGQNNIVVKLVSGDGPSGLYFTILSDQELQAK
jgi:putative membrane-bound dehydrogenase-like protein